MKKFLFALIVIALPFACVKEKGLNPVEDKPEGETVVISATLPEDLSTKVAFEPTIASGKPTAMALTWEAGDQIRVYDHSDHSLYEDFTLDPSCVGTNKGVFTGTAISASAYDLEIINDALTVGTQTQASDGDTGHLKYYAGVENVLSYDTIDFTDFSSILALTAKMPSSEVAATITSVEIEASENIFGTGNTLTLILTTPGDEGSDGILHLYATLPVGTKDITAGTSLVVHFNSSAVAHTVYTRYIELGAKHFTAGKLNTININASNSASFANASPDNIGESTNPYLIGDKYQMAKIAEELEAGETKYFKMIDDVDLDGETWTPLNPSPFTCAVNFNGNNKKISHLGAALFNDLNGTIVNLTIEDASVSGGKNITGILANTIKTAASTVTNVDVVGTVTTPSFSSSITATQYAGGLIGEIDTGTTNITDCDVINTNVSGTLAGGVVGFANALVMMSGCTYSGGTVSATARYCGGMLGSTSDYNSVISDCHVENATVTSSSDRVGGFCGQLQKKAQIKGCTVGTNTQRVTVESTLASNTVNAGGFVGVCYGRITKNSDVRSKAYVNITCTNTETSADINIGGFIGYLEGGPVEYSDSDAYMGTLIGNQVGGFVGYINKASTIDNCSSTGTIKGQNYVGGFIGNTGSYNHVITNNSASGSVTGNATVGGFAGMIPQGTWTKNSTSCTVSGQTNIGGFAGQINGNATISKSASTGATVNATGNVCGGFAAIAANGASISDSYSTSNLTGATRKRGGLIGHVTAGTVSINRCYSTSTISANFELGGLIGFVADALSTFTLSNSAAWNSSITANNRLSSNWSSASIVGVSSLTCTLTDNYRNPAMTLYAYWGNNGYGVQLTTAFQQPNVNSTNPLTDWDGNAVTSGTMRPYNGKCESGKTLSQLASTTLGWDDEIWDFTADLPTLK